MKIAIIGAGFTGLTAGLRLTKAGHQATIFEKDSLPGGLAVGFREPKWLWPLEKHYHHCFTNDKSILGLAKEIEYPMITKRPETSVYINDKFYKLDTPLDVLKFSELDFLQRLRMGFTIAFFKFNPFWKTLERYRVSTFLPKLMGEKPYNLIWKPLIAKKFGPFAKDISLAWFWARIAKRTPSLVYFQGGFLEFANAIVSTIEKNGGKVIFNDEVKMIDAQKNGTVRINNSVFDKVIITLPSISFVQIASQLPTDYKQKLLNMKGLSAINLVLQLKKPFFKNKTYWLNICDTEIPFTGIVEHTNFIDKKYYNNESLVYVLNYLPHDHPFMSLDKNKLLKIYDPFLSKINKNYKSEIVDIHLFPVRFAQPIIPVNYSKLIPPFKTPLKNVYLANMQQVYPWDRGTNYAVELGEKIADIVFSA
jgi:protoporphyrinogen oxidase